MQLHVYWLKHHGGENWYKKKESSDLENYIKKVSRPWFSFFYTPVCPNWRHHGILVSVSSSFTLRTTNMLPHFFFWNFGELFLSIDMRSLPTFKKFNFFSFLAFVTTFLYSYKNGCDFMFSDCNSKTLAVMSIKLCWIVYLCWWKNFQLYDLESRDFLHNNVGISQFSDYNSVVVVLISMKL